MSMPPPFRMLVVGIIALAGCSAVLRDPVPGRMLSQASPSDDDAGDDEPSGLARPGPVTGWADRQRFIFERAWREIRADLAYENIDSFRDLDAEARRDVLVMRREMEAAREAAAARDEAQIR